MRLCLTTFACGFALVFGVSSVRAADTLDWNEPTAKFAEFVANLSAGRLEDAWQTYRVMLPEPPKSPQTPFEPDPFESFQKAVGRFPANVEAFRLIATRNYSERSRRMYFLADTDYGPYLVETVIFRARDQWFFGHFGYQSLMMSDANWHKLHEDVLPVTKLPEPVAVPLPKREPAAETAGK
jgi:hypothetical protein